MCFAVAEAKLWLVYILYLANRPSVVNHENPHHRMNFWIHIDFPPIFIDAKLLMIRPRNLFISHNYLFQIHNLQFYNHNTSTMTEKRENAMKCRNSTSCFSLRFVKFQGYTVATSWHKVVLDSHCVLVLCALFYVIIT